MAEYRGFRIPEDVEYDIANHVWLRVDGDLVVLGATSPAAGYAGDIINITIKKPGTHVDRGAIVATVESAKFMGPMRSPVTGTVVEINDAVKKKATLVNEDPYANWVVRIRPDKLAEERGLLTPGAEAAEKYKPIIDDWGISAA